MLVIFGGLSGYSSDDINKFLWMVRIGGGVYPDHIKEKDYTKTMFCVCLHQLLPHSGHFWAKKKIVGAGGGGRGGWLLQDYLAGVSGLQQHGLNGGRDLQWRVCGWGGGVYPDHIKEKDYLTSNVSGPITSL